ncbi:GNAT family N-acetyltransferase [Mesorhizobium australicum]|uniref:GNAT family N-acetyltransferase n=1 Tax=Mesorhizobium TaxID=68287 RepID=UPI0003CE4459|nr:MULTISPECIES: GNAT family N-acetyltransferase [unclassified Mesorhizobium]ESY97227.1 GNAT family acetyltransferase [Mesorhizobium sp. LNHC229A00]ESZ01614.1 GNAT family acetyltransferase [Mesorhizobium sp. LNHC209A00]
MNIVEIGPLTASRETLAQLTDLLVETVAAGGSVSFMHPLASDAASAFWETSLAAAARGQRTVIGAWDGGALVGTVTLLLDCPPNQPHRAEIAKLMTSVGQRGRGIGTRLMLAAERLAAEKGRTLLVLDTATEEGASALYEKLGFTLAGEVPDYALKPHGGLTGTLIYWKRIGTASR